MEKLSGNRRGQYSIRINDQWRICFVWKDRDAEIVLGKRAISPDTALRLSRFFGMSEAFWINLQTRYDLEVHKDKLAGRPKREVRIYQASKPAGR